ncbi:TonB-dependent receptor [Sphingomonas ginkgonis]|uniref:TonB-dependent receptor n=2 Tax=Sphingomonas ginkgonis TaxID=2315330 RepID=A0A3R9YP01_9SPHN|nr:TonB-dependent receptor [Sphingomonas ginkgonis]
MAATPAVAQSTTAPATPQPTGPQTGETPDQTPSPSAAPKGADNTAENSPADNAIVVTGIRASLAASERIKKNNPVIVEAISAEDIGKLPDVSIADSLARLPGVTAQRLEGRDQRLSIRGLGPDFGVTLLNGREQVTVGDNRGVEYDQYPSEFFRNVVVYKSANASVVPSGIAGTVDLRTLRPLNEKPTLAVQLRGQMNSHKSLNPEVKRTGYRASGTYVDRFAHDTIGVAIGVSTMTQPTQNERYNAWGFPNSTATGGNLLLGGAKPYVESSKLQRTGVVGTLEFKPSDRWHTTLDVLYSKFKETQYLRGIEFPIAPDWGSNATITNYTASNGLVTDATVSGVVGVVRNDYNRRNANNFSIGFNNVVSLTDRVRFTLDESWSRAKRTDFLLENYTGTGYNQSGAKDTIHISQNSDGTFDIVPTLNYGNASNLVITDPRGWGYNGTEAVVQAGFLNRPSFKDDLKSIRASLDGDLDGFFNKWEVGAVYSRRSKTSSYSSAFLCPKDGNPSCTVSSGTALSAPIPQDAIVGTVPLAYLGVPSMIALNPLYLYNNVYDAAPDNRPDSLARDYNVTEKVLTGYAQINIDSRLGAIPVTGAIGAQVVHSDQGSSGFTSSFSAGPPPVVTVATIDGGSKYTDFLPSAALAFQVVPSGFLKLGVSKTMIRPRLDQERVTSVVSFNAANIGRYDPSLFPVFSAYGGNAQLKPYKSLNFDGSAEYYFRKGGYVSLSAYYKRLTNYVDPNRSFAFDFAPYAALLDPATRALVQGKTVGLVSGPANDGKGHILGQELTVSLPFSNFVPALDGFGFFGSIAHVSSKVRYASQPTPIDIPGLSKYVGTAEGYFEKHGFQARVSYRYRSKFIGEVAGLSATPTFRTAKPEGILDAQVGYEFQGGFMHGLSITAQAKNLTNRPFVTYENDDTRRVIDYQKYGRDYYLTLAYKF